MQAAALFHSCFYTLLEPIIALLKEQSPAFTATLHFVCKQILILSLLFKIRFSPFIAAPPRSSGSSKPPTLRWSRRTLVAAILQQEYPRAQEAKKASDRI